MRRDARVQFTRIVDAQKVVQWECWAEIQRLKSAPTDIEDGIAVDSSNVKLKINYARQLDDVLDNPTKYNIEFTDRKIAKAQVLRIQQMMNRRYVEVMI